MRYTRIQQETKTKHIVIIFISVFALNAQFEWNEPVQLSETGIFPDICYGDPAITVDNNGTIHAFWTKDTELEFLTWYSQIEYRRSTDGGLTWSTTMNLTPEYNFYRIIEIQALCDSQNNVHLFYLVGNSPYKVMYKKFNGNSWTIPYEISPFATTNLRVGIDRTDRIYLTWYYGTTYYTYCDAADSSPIWEASTKISNENIGVNSFFVFDENENLYSVGQSVNPIYPYFYKFDKIQSEWTIKKMFDINASGCALTFSKNKFCSNISIGPTNDENLNYDSSKEINDSLWSGLNYINKNNEWKFKELFVDKEDNLHLFEKHFGDINGLIYSNKQESNWTTEFIQSNQLYSYNCFDVAYLPDSIFYFAYEEQELSTYNLRIMFQSKRIETGIEKECGQLVRHFNLFQNYPNPFNNETRIQISLEKVFEVEINIFNSKGELVHNLVSGKLNKGNHNFTFKADGINSGLYFYMLSLGDEVQAIKKMLYLK